MTGLAGAWIWAARAGQGFVLGFAVASLAEVVLGYWARRPGDGTRSSEWRRLMVVALGRLAADALALLLAFFVLPGEWTLIGTALGLLAWRAVWTVRLQPSVRRQ